MELLYADNGKIYTHEYIEIYIPKEYFDNGIAINRGSTVESEGIVYVRNFPKGEPGDIKLFNVPVVTEFNVYNTKYETITIRDKHIDTLVLEYLPDSHIMHQTLPTGRDIAKVFVNSVLGGKLPKTLNYTQLADIWWKNLTISSISYKVPSSIYEMILAATYRNPHNQKQRYGQLFGRQDNPTGYDYTTGNVRDVVKNLSTFSGMVFEDMGSMISSGLLNSITDTEEAVSPLEKIIHY